MINALILIENSPHFPVNTPPFCLPLGPELALERIARTVLRGPFGSTIVATAPEHSARAMEILAGFSVRHVPVKSAASLLSDGIRGALSFRERWLKARAAAAARFDEASSKSAKKGKAKKTDWSHHRGSSDVKIRGLARSFDRDGIILFPTDHPALSIELQAQLVEAFGREGADKGASARPFAQAVYQGERGYPIILDVTVAEEVAAIPPGKNFDAWLLDNLARVQDVPVQDPGATATLRNEEEYKKICALLKIKRV